MRNRSRQPAFTLLELVLVMMVICIAMALIAVSLRGWQSGSKLRNASTEFLAATVLARTQAVSDTTVCRLQIDPSGSAYTITQQKGEQFNPINSNLGRTRVLPDGLRIELLQTTDATGKNAGTPYIEFYPTGRTQPARIRITADDGHQAIIECAVAAEPFRILSSEEIR